MAQKPILFPSAASANALVAGIPFAARAVMALEEAGPNGEYAPRTIAVPGGWEPSPKTLAEFARLQMPVTAVASETLNGARAIDGFTLFAPDADFAGRDVDAILAQPAYDDPSAARHLVAAASRRIIAATGKPTDGLVSRALNRPVSQWLSRHLLKLAWVRPIHATIAAGLVGVAMALALFLGGPTGLYAGAVLFQLASMIDGVDGEIARATFRSSKLGATLDTASDAATNLAFLGGVTFNLWQQNAMFGAQMGLLGLVWLALGLTLLGAQSLRAGGPLSFDALKHRGRGTQSGLVHVLAKIASRDVYALVLALLILAEFASAAMTGFALAVLAWLMLVIVALARRLL